MGLVDVHSTVCLQSAVHKVVKEEVEKKLPLPVSSERYPVEGTVSVSSIMFELLEQSEKLWWSVQPPHFLILSPGGGGSGQGSCLWTFPLFCLSVFRFG